MAYSYVRYTGNGSTKNFTFSFPYLDQTHVQALVDGVVTTAFTFLNASTLAFTTAPANGSLIEIRRVTPKDTPIVNFADGSVLLERDLDLLATFNLYVSQETDDDVQEGLFTGIDNTFSANSKRISNVVDPVNPQDVATKNYADNAMGSQLAQATVLVNQAADLVNQADSIISSFTVSLEDPSGGNDGDIWFKVTV